MATTFDENQVQQLRDIWAKLGGLDSHADDFVSGLQFYVTNTPRLIVGRNKKIEDEERKQYEEVAKQCEKLLEALTVLPPLDRINVLSLRERRPEFNDRSLPMCDPYDYVKTIQENADFYGNEIGKCDKYVRQLKGLETHLGKNLRRLKPAPSKKISRYRFVKLAAIIFDAKEDSIKTAVRDHGIWGKK